MAVSILGKIKTTISKKVIPQSVYLNTLRDFLWVKNICQNDYKILVSNGIIIRFPVQDF